MSGPTAAAAAELVKDARKGIFAACSIHNELQKFMIHTLGIVKPADFYNYFRADSNLGDKLVAMLAAGPDETKPDKPGKELRVGRFYEVRDRCKALYES